MQRTSSRDWSGPRVRRAGRIRPREPESAAIRTSWVSSTRTSLCSPRSTPESDAPQLTDELRTERCFLGNVAIVGNCALWSGAPYKGEVLHDQRGLRGRLS